MVKLNDFMVENSLIDQYEIDDYLIAFKKDELVIYLKTDNTILFNHTIKNYYNDYLVVNKTYNQVLNILDFKLLPTSYFNVIVSVTTEQGIHTIVDHPLKIIRDNYTFDGSLTETQIKLIKWYVDRHLVVSKFWNSVEFKELILQFDTGRWGIYAWISSDQYALSLCRSNPKLFHTLLFAPFFSEPIMRNEKSHNWILEIINQNNTLSEVEFSHLFMLDDNSLVSVIQKLS